MSILPGHLQESRSDLVCKLKKAICGLKQSPRAWYARLSHLLINNGLKMSVADPSLFVKRGPSGSTIVLIYGDDIVITGDDRNEVSKLKNLLHKRFEVRDLRILKYFLGLEAAYSRKGIFLNQRKYVLDLLHKTSKLGAKPSDNLVESNCKLTLDGELFYDKKRFQRLVERII